METEIIGILIKEIKDEFGLEEDMVYIGPQNIEHIRNKHPKDYENYYEHISEIISSPDYYGRNLKDDSIELIKEFNILGKIMLKLQLGFLKKEKYLLELYMN